MIEPEVIYQDDVLLVLNKAPGWVVNDSTTTANQSTIQGWLTKNFEYEISTNFEERSGIVHRLDKETSGILLIAKTSNSFKNLQAQFKDRIVQKTYTALAHGEIKPAEGIIDMPIARLSQNRKKFGIVPGGREATTEYQTLEVKHLEKEPYTLVELYPHTGRTHQIRVHLKYLGYPIVSDRTYVGRKRWRHDTKWCPRLFLHARKIVFNHPTTGKSVEYEAKLPDDLQHALKNLS